MNFDERFQIEAEQLFDSRAVLEFKNGDHWEHLANQRLIDDAFSNRARSCALASTGGLRLSNGMAVRFKL